MIYFVLKAPLLSQDKHVHGWQDLSNLEPGMGIQFVKYEISNSEENTVTSKSKFCL